MSSQTYSPLYTGAGSAGSGDLHYAIADLTERQSSIVLVPIALAVFSLLALTVLITNTGERFSLDE